MCTIKGCQKVGVGYSVNWKGKELCSGKVNIGPRAEVYDTEMLGIALVAREAVQQAIQLDAQHISFNSDNSAAVQTITKLTPHSAQSCLQMFRKEIDCFLELNPNNHVTIRWGPGLQGIRGNKHTDQLANEAGHLPSNPIFNCTVTWSRAQATHARHWKARWLSSHVSQRQEKPHAYSEPNLTKLTHLPVCQPPTYRSANFRKFAPNLPKFTPVFPECRKIQVN